MKAWTHDNGTLAYPSNEADEQVLSALGWFPVGGFPVCAVCDGSGKDPEDRRKKCPDCKGE